MQIEPNKFYSLKNWEYHYGIGKDWLSKSALSEIILPPSGDGSPRQFRYNRDHPEELDIFDKEAEKFNRGTAFHTHFLEPDNFKDEIVPIETFSGTGSRAARNEWKDEIKASGKTPITPEYIEAMKEFEKLLHSGEHDIARNIIYNDDNFTEKSGFWIDKETEMKFKMRADIMSPYGVIWDLKTHASIKRFMNQAISLHYDLQAALALEGATKITDHKHGRFGFVVFHLYKKKPFDIEVVEASKDFLRSGLKKLKYVKSLYQHCTESGKWPGKFKDEVKLLDIPEFRRMQMQMEKGEEDYFGF